MRSIAVPEREALDYPWSSHVYSCNGICAATLVSRTGDGRIVLVRSTLYETPVSASTLEANVRRCLGMRNPEPVVVRDGHALLRTICPFRRIDD